MRRLLLFLALMAMAGSLTAQTVEGVEVVKARLIANVDAAVPGQTLIAGVELTMAPKWHTYWQFAGDAGIPTALKWTLPEGVAAGTIQWPLPESILEPGDIQVYAYHDTVLLQVPITVPVNFSDKTLTIQVAADWLVCAEICVPGSAQLELTLPVQSRANPANAAEFAAAQALVPSNDPPPFSADWQRAEIGEGENRKPGWKIAVSGLPTDAKTVQFFPAPPEGMEVGHPVISLVTNGRATIEIAAPDAFPAVIALEPANRGFWSAPMVETTSPAGGGLSLGWALFYGFLGGLILNLMPCVLPVISLKIFGFMRQAGEAPGRIFRHGLAFSAGVFAWFLGLAALIIALQASGEQVTWAFQFQNSGFILFISAVVFVFALNLFGVFEIVLPGQATTQLSQVAGREGYSGSFFQGLLATLLATPCTAPFLGTALGFAFSQPAWVIAAMFASVALGMSSPYLVLTARPGWMRFLPKPGAWMERLKQFMGFPLIATLLWLLYVLGNQKGLDAVIYTGSLLLALALALWIYGSFAHAGRGRVLAPVLALVIAAGAGFYFWPAIANAEPPEKGAVAEKDGIAWRPFSQSAVDEWLAAGKPVFIDFTADWCISCKFNERTAINVPAVRELIAQRGIVAVKADWTRSDPEITAALKKFGRVGVPFYVFYPQGNQKPPVILPEILTEKIVLAALGSN